jgi:hypothetical protein
VDDHSRTPPSPPDRVPTVVIVLGARADRPAVTAWCERLRTLLCHAPGSVVDCDVALLTGSAVEVLDALARLRLTAMRGGGRLRLRGADPGLVAALELLGFANLLPTADPPARADADGADRRAG